MGTETLAAAIRRARLGAGLSQKEVALKLGVVQPTVSNWEIGKNPPADEQRKALEAILGPLQGPVEGGPTAATQDTSAIGVWLNTVRTRKGLTVVELATRADVSSGTIYNLEAGRIDNPQAKTRERLAKALGENPPDEIVKATEDAASIEGLGNLVDFDPHDSSGLPEGSGVYVFYDISQRPIYVGESSNLKGRLKSYNEKFWFKRPIVENASFIAIKDEKMRKQVEKILIKFLKANAVLNKQHVERE